MTSRSEGLFIDRLSMSFGGLRVFEDVTMHIPPAQVTACIGPNGAGKTTLINVLCGVYRAQGGEAFLDDRSLANIKPHQTVQRGIARTFQDVRIFPELSAIENVLIAMPRQRGERLRHLFHYDRKLIAENARNRRAALDMLDYMAMADQADRPARDLPFGQQKLLALLRAVATGARFLLLDEPAAGVEMEMIPRITALLRKLAKEDGRASLLIEHNVEVVREIADRAIVLQGGSIVIAGTCDEVLRDERVIREYLGKIYDA